MAETRKVSADNPHLAGCTFTRAHPTSLSRRPVWHIRYPTRFTTFITTCCGLTDIMHDVDVTEEVPEHICSGCMIRKMELDRGKALPSTKEGEISHRKLLSTPRQERRRARRAQKAARDGIGRKLN